MISRVRIKALWEERADGRVILDIKSCVFSDIFTQTHTSIQITPSSVGLNLQYAEEKTLYCRL